MNIYVEKRLELYKYEDLELIKDKHFDAYRKLFNY